jgi:hypothetical protein
VREILFDPQSTEFIVVTIPTVKATTISAMAATFTCFNCNSCLLLYSYTSLGNTNHAAWYINNLVQKKERNKKKAANRL